jgi:hypothetical protein
MPASLSLTAEETAKQGITLAMKAFERPGKQVATANAMGVAESTISKLKNGPMAEVITMLAHGGLKVVPSDYETLDPHAAEFLKRLHAKVTHLQPDLLWRPDAP